MKLTLVATCLFGLERLLGEEIEALGYERLETIDGRVTFAGDEEAVARAVFACRWVYICCRPAARGFTERRRFLASACRRCCSGTAGWRWS